MIRLVKYRLSPFESVYIVLGVAAIGSDNIFDTKELIAVDKMLESDKSEAIVASGGNWRLWPFSFRRSNSTKAGQPTLSGSRRIDLAEDESVSSNKDSRKRERAITPTTEQLASLNLKEGRNVVTFTFSTPMLGKQEVNFVIALSYCSHFSVFFLTLSLSKFMN